MSKKPKSLFRIIAFLLCFFLAFEQSGFAQVAGQLDISGYITQLHQSLTVDKFRPLHLRYLSYDNQNNSFKLLLDKGSAALDKPNETNELNEQTKVLLNYFFIGVSLPNDTFWVNLRPDSPDNIIDPLLARTDVGKILLEADVQLKKDTAKFTSPDSPEGREYWDKLYQKAGEIFGSEDITIPTLTRPWIVPDEIIIRETTDSAYIYKATLKVMLEEDYLLKTEGNAVGTRHAVSLQQYEFKDDRLKELNIYSSQLIRELIIPKLIQEVNTSKKYAPLRQVYYSLILASWFKARNQGKDNPYARLINRGDLAGLTSKEDWSKTTYFEAYQKSFKDGEYNIREPVYTPYGQTIRSYFSGGIAGIAIKAMPDAGQLTLVDRETGARITVLQAIGRISSAQNPYLLAADILEAAPEQNARTTVLENLVVRLAEKPLAEEELRKRVNEIEAAHRVAPEHHVGPRKPDGTYSKGDFTLKELLRKSKEMPSFTPVQRRNIIEYALAGKAPSENNEDRVIKPSLISAKYNIELLSQRQKTMLTSAKYAKSAEEIFKEHPLSSVPIFGGSDKEKAQIKKALKLLAPLIPVGHAQRLKGINLRKNGWLASAMQMGAATIIFAPARINIIMEPNISVLDNSYEIAHELGHIVAISLPGAKESWVAHVKSLSDVYYFKTYAAQRRSINFFILAILCLLPRIGIFAAIVEFFYIWYTFFLHDRIMEVVKDDSLFLSRYSKIDPGEDFAETYAYFALDKEGFKKIIAANPLLKPKYDAMKEIFVDPTGITPEKSRISRRSLLKGGVLAGVAAIAGKLLFTQRSADLTQKSSKQEEAFGLSASSKDDAVAKYYETTEALSRYDEKKACWEWPITNESGYWKASSSITEQRGNYIGVAAGFQNYAYIAAMKSVRERDPSFRAFIVDIDPFPIEVVHPFRGALIMCARNRLEFLTWLSSRRLDYMPTDAEVAKMSVNDLRIYLRQHSIRDNSVIRRAWIKIGGMFLEPMKRKIEISYQILEDYWSLEGNRYDPDVGVDFWKKMNNPYSLISSEESFRNIQWVWNTGRFKGIVGDFSGKGLPGVGKVIKDVLKTDVGVFYVSNVLTYLNETQRETFIQTIRNLPFADIAKVIRSSDPDEPLVLNLQTFILQLEKMREPSREKSAMNGSTVGVTASAIKPGRDLPVSPPSPEPPRIKSEDSPSTGGIDFRSLPIVTQAIGNLRMNMDTQAIGRLRSADVSRELEDIQRMVDAGISPSGERIKECVQASSVQGNLDIERIVSCISDILRHEEETCLQTEPVLRDILVVLESTRNSQELNEVFVGKI